MMEHNKINPQSVIAPEAILNVKQSALTKERNPAASKAENFGSKTDGAFLYAENLAKVAQSIEGFLKELQIDLKIQVHKGTGRTMFKIISKDDGKVVREVPPEEFLNIAAKMQEMVGLLFNKDA